MYSTCPIFWSKPEKWVQMITVREQKVSHAFSTPGQAKLFPCFFFGAVGSHQRPNPRAGGLEHPCNDWNQTNPQCICSANWTRRGLESLRGQCTSSEPLSRSRPEPKPVVLKSAAIFTSCCWLRPRFLEMSPEVQDNYSASRAGEVEDRDIPGLTCMCLHSCEYGFVFAGRCASGSRAL